MTAADDHGNNPSTLDLIAMRGTAWAAMEIERLRAENGKLRSSLAFYANPNIYKPDWRGHVQDLTFSARNTLSETSHDN